MMNSTAVRTFGKLDIHVLEHARSYTFPLANQPEEQVLSSYVVVVEPLRLVLSECQDLACPIREFVETIHRHERPLVFWRSKATLRAC